jgi:hypothetical protein
MVFDEGEDQLGLTTLVRMELASIVAGLFEINSL